LSTISKQNSTIHQKQLKNLISEQQNEIEKLKINHTKNKNLIKNESDKDIVSLQLNNQEKKLNQIKKHEEILNSLKDNLEKVKETTNKQLDQTKSTHENKLNSENLLFEQDLRNLKAKNALLTQEAEQISNSSLKRIKTNLEMDKANLKRDSLEDLSMQKSVATSKKRISQDEFTREQTKEMDKFNKALYIQKSENKSILQRNKTTLDTSLKSQKEAFTGEVEVLKKKNNTKLVTEQKAFETNFTKNSIKNESELQGMLSRKEVLLNDLEGKLKERSELVLERKDDVFYSMGKIDFKVNTLSNKEGYEVKIPVNEEEAKNIDFKAEKRELRLSLQRSHKFNVSENGRQDYINKLETYMSKIPVEEIIDPKQITKSYEDGVLTFKIGLA
jgi:hypothetical protein